MKNVALLANKRLRKKERRILWLCLLGISLGILGCFMVFSKTFNKRSLGIINILCYICSRDQNFFIHFFGNTQKQYAKAVAMGSTFLNVHMKSLFSNFTQFISVTFFFW